MPNYNSNDLGFKPKREPRARSLRKSTCSAKIAEPDTRLPPPPERRLYYEDPELAEREKIAQEEVERKKLCTAPAYNKGAYTYVYSEEEAKSVGKKSG